MNKDRVSIVTSSEVAMRIFRLSNIWIRVGVVPLGLVACATLSPRANAVLVVAPENFEEQSGITGCPGISVGPEGTPRKIATDPGSPLGSKAIYGAINAAHAVTAARTALDIAVNAKIEAKDDFPVPSLSFTSVASKATRYEDLRNELGPLPVLGTIPDCGRHELPHSL